MTSRLHGLLEGVFDAWVVSFASLRAECVIAALARSCVAMKLEGQLAGIPEATVIVPLTGVG